MTPVEMQLQLIREAQAQLACTDTPMRRRDLTRYIRRLYKELNLYRCLRHKAAKMKQQPKNDKNTEENQNTPRTGCMEPTGGNI